MACGNLASGFAKPCEALQIGVFLLVGGATSIFLQQFFRNYTLSVLALGNLTIMNPAIADMAFQTTNPHFLDRIPNEVVCNVMASMPDLPTLCNFVNANSSLRILYQSSYKNIFLGTMRQDPSMQIQKLICVVLSIRNGAGLQEIHEDHYSDFLDMFLDNEHRPLEIDEFDDPLSALQDIAEISHDMEDFIASFIASCLREPGSIACFHKKAESASKTETHRIRRAFWRLHLLFWLFKYRLEAYGLEAIVPGANEEFADYVYAEDHLTNWELEEVECAYYHLRDYYRQNARLGQQDAHFKAQPFILQRLLENLGYNKHEAVPSDLDSEYSERITLKAYRKVRENRVTSIFDWSRDYYNSPVRIKTLWSDIPCTNRPNTGWEYYVRYGGEGGMIDEPEHDCIGRGPVIFHQWGYCMWDRERFVRWGLLEGKHSLIDGQKWKDEKKRRAPCEFCS